MILPFKGTTPKIASGVFVAPSADIIGDVIIGEQSSVWFQTVIRGDVNYIRVGARTNIQDSSMLHVTRKTSPLIIGDDVTVGHSVTLHGCTLGNRILVGMGAVIMDGAIIGDDCVIAAGALVTKDKNIPARSLVVGSPGRVIRELTDSELEFLKKSANNYVNDIQDYLASGVEGLVPPSKLN